MFRFTVLLVIANGNPESTFLFLFVGKAAELTLRVHSAKRGSESL